MVEKKVTGSFQRHDKDTWSPEMQIGLLWDQIKLLQEHLAMHKKDFDAKRSLLKKVATRRKFLRYLKETNIDTYTAISKKVGLKV